MPRFRQPESMRKAALLTIGTHFEQICYGCTKETMARMIESDEYLLVKGPFSSWPASMLEEVLEAVGERRSRGRAVLHLLMQPHLESLSLPCGAGDVYYAIRFLQERCQALKKLDLSYVAFVSPGELSDLVKQLPQLRTINFHMTLTTDQVLGTIGTYCSQVRDLDIGSTPVTDYGISALCYSELGEIQGQQLSRLVLTESRVTPKGVATALRALPQLRDVEYDSMFQVFEVLNDSHSYIEWPEEDDAPPALLVGQYNLTSIRSTAEVDSGQGLSAAVRLCPSARNVSLVAGILPNTALWDLTGLQHLTELSLTNSTNLSLDFWDGVLPLLQMCGRKLKNLILTRFACADVTAIGMACPHLQNLALAEICHFIPVDIPQAGMFQNLEALELWAAEGVLLSAQVIRQLLTFCPKIRNILLRRCDSVSDSLLAEIVTFNPMVSLTHATFDNCPHVTVSSLISLLETTNELNMLRIWSCQRVTKLDYERLQHIVSTANLDVYIDWYPFSEPA